MLEEPKESPEISSLPTIPLVIPPLPPPTGTPPGAETASGLEAAPITGPTAPVVTAPPPEAAAAPASTTDRHLGTTLALIALVFAIVAAGLVFAGYNTAQAELQPARVVQAYCRDLRSENFSAAYGLLSSTYQAQVTLAQFTLTNQLQDGVDGKVHACPTATGSGIDFSFGRPQNRVAFLITIVRNTSFTGHIELNRQQNTWKVNAVEQSLQGSDVAPLLVADTFCRALIQGNYVTAYHMLSSRQQSLAPESAFAQQFKSAFGDAIHLESCTVDYGSYHLQASTAAVSMTFNLAISMPAAGSLTTSLVTVLNFTQESGSWKLDDFTPVPPLP